MLLLLLLLLVDDDLPPLLLPRFMITEMDLARGLCSRDRSQFLTRAPADSLADSGEVTGERGEASLLGPLVVVVAALAPLVWILGVKGRERRCLCEEVVVSSEVFSSGYSLGEGSSSRTAWSSLARRFSSLPLALASSLSCLVLAFSSSIVIQPERLVSDAYTLWRLGEVTMAYLSTAVSNP